MVGRVAILALSLFCSGITAVQAHALPGSVLTFSQDQESLTLSISLPVEDLALAAPSLAMLESWTPDQDMPLADIAAYFEEHLVLRNASGNFALSLTQTALQTDANHNVGEYVLLVLQFTSDVPADGDIFPLSLTYDAVMHEIRNHRATVLWAEPGSSLQLLADFGFRTTGGSQQTVVLERP